MNLHGPHHGAEFYFYNNICLLTCFNTITQWPCNNIEEGDVGSFKMEDDGKEMRTRFVLKFFFPLEGDV